MKKLLTIVISVFVLASCGDMLNQGNKPDSGAWQLGDGFEDGYYTGEGRNVPLNSPENNRFMKRIVKVGLLLPLSGNASALGQSMQDAATLALWDQYANISPSDARSVQIIILPKDTKGTMDGAENAAREALGEGVDIILGPLYSSSVTAVAPLARERGVQMVTFSNNKSVAGDGVFVMGFQPEEQIKRVVEYSTSRGQMNFASLTPNDAYGEVVKNSLRKAVDESNQEGENGVASVKKQVSYTHDKSRYARPIRGLLDFDEKKYRKSFTEEVDENADGDDATEELEEEEKPFDALLIPEGGVKLMDIAKLLKYYNFNGEEVQLIGSGQWDNPQILKADVLHGAWFATSPPDRKEMFFGHFEKQFQYKPQRLASLAYDAMALAVVLSFSNEFSMDALTNPAGFNGPADGLFRFNRNGIVERKLAVLEVTPDGFTVIDEAEESFEVSGY